MWRVTVIGSGGVEGHARLYGLSSLPFRGKRAAQVHEVVLETARRELTEAGTQARPSAFNEFDMEVTQKAYEELEALRDEIVRTEQVQSVTGYCRQLLDWEGEGASDADVSALRLRPQRLATEYIQKVRSLP